MALGKNAVGDIQFGHIGLTNPGQTASPGFEFME